MTNIKTISPLQSKHCPRVHVCLPGTITHLFGVGSLFIWSLQPSKQFIYAYLNLQYKDCYLQGSEVTTFFKIQDSNIKGTRPWLIPMNLPHPEKQLNARTSNSSALINIQPKEQRNNCKQNILPLLVKLHQRLYVIGKLHILYLKVWVSLPKNSENKWEMTKNFHKGQE